MVSAESAPANVSLTAVRHSRRYATASNAGGSMLARTVAMGNVASACTPRTGMSSVVPLTVTLTSLPAGVLLTIAICEW